MGTALGLGLIISLLVIWISHRVYRWRNPKCSGVLPPGSMGWPLIGETIQFFSPYKSYDVLPFIKTRTERYGTLFRTSLLGTPMVVSTDAETNYYIFQQEGKYFQIWYTESFSNILGEDNMSELHGAIHKYIKKLVLNLVSPESLRERLLVEMDGITSKYLSSCATHGIVDVKEGVADMVFDYFAKKVFSYDEAKEKKNLSGNYKALSKGLLSLPLNIPGTAYHACLQGRERAITMIKDALKERRSSSNVTHDQGHDFLDFLLEELDEEETLLTEKIIVDLVFLLPFAAFETSSTTITLAMKFLNDHPEVLAELKKEHEAIIGRRSVNEKSTITWSEYKSMTFTHMVINETIRLGNMVPGIFRRVIKEVQLKGYTIPKGWLVMVSPPSIHLNPDIYEDPLTFNPWRWEGKELHAASKNFMGFGGGIRLCVGADYAKFQVAIFLHHLVTKYRWTVVNGGEIVRSPSIIFPNGLHIKISEECK